MARITLALENDEIIDLLQDISEVFDRKRFKRLMDRIGNLMVQQTEARFSTQKDPRGIGWAKRRSSLEPNRAILTKTGRLRKSIRYNADESSVEVGTNVEYAKYHQQSGVQTVRTKGLPARPFLGVSIQDERLLLQLIDQFLDEVLNDGRF